MSVKSSEPGSLPLRTLYHYTTQEGLLGIIESRSIWASEIRYLNDTTEFQTGLEVVSAALRARLDDIGSDEGDARGEAIFRDFATVEEAKVFVLSLTEKGDDLSQWRAYGGSHSGFSIGFDIEGLKVLAAEHSFSLERCLYDVPEQNVLAETIVNSALAWLTAGDRMTQRRRREFRRSMIQTAPLFKDYRFRDEQEWRLVSVSHEVTTPEIGFRSGISTIIPHYCLPLFAADGSCPLSSVIVGPTPHADLSLDSTYALLRSRGFKHAKVRKSEIPLRTW